MSVSPSENPNDATPALVPATPVSPAERLRPYMVRPGEVRNPVGRRSLGTIFIDHLTELGERRDLCPQVLRRIIRDPKAHPLRIAAAHQLLRAMREPDMAHFEGFVAGKETLAQLRARGIDTTAIKHVGVRKQPTRAGVNETREITLARDAGEALDRILDRTLGKPAQHVSMDVAAIARIEFVSADMPELDEELAAEKARIEGSRADVITPAPGNEEARP